MAVKVAPSRRSVAVQATSARERQRLGLTHELGHLVLDVGDRVDAEKAAFRFSAAMLISARAVRRDVGERRRRIDLKEQAERIAEEYRPDPDWQAVSGEDFVGMPGTA